MSQSEKITAPSQICHALSMNTCESTSLEILTRHTWARAIQHIQSFLYPTQVRKVKMQQDRCSILAWEYPIVVWTRPPASHFNLIKYTSLVWCEQQKGDKKDQRVNDWRKQTYFSVSSVPLLSITPSFVSVSIWCVQETHCYICILMTPPVAPEAGPSALPRDQLGPRPGVCCAPL